jgi:secreted trypsin-like serine protease
VAILVRRLRLPLAIGLLTLGVSPALAVFGGTVVGNSDPLAKSVAAILYQTSDGAHLCTAVALAPKLVLTAAHCTDGDSRLIKVIFGTDLSAIGDDRIRAVRAVARAAKTSASKGMHAYQNPDDVALVLLDSPAPAGTRFASLADAMPAASAIRVAGYGATSELRKPDSWDQHQVGFDKVLRTTTMPLLSTAPALLVGDQTHGRGTCTGDSGGAAFLAGDKSLTVIGLAIGVASPRDNNDYCRGKAYFASIPRWKAWILSAAAGFKQKL